MKKIIITCVAISFSGLALATFVNGPASMNQSTPGVSTSLQEQENEEIKRQRMEEDTPLPPDVISPSHGSEIPNSTPEEQRMENDVEIYTEDEDAFELESEE